MLIGIGLALNQQQAAAAYTFTNSEAATYVAAMTVKPDNTRKALIDTYIGALKAAGIWTLLDCLYLLAAHTTQAAVINVKTPGTFNGATVNSPTFTADRGYVGNGTSSRVRTNFTPSTQGVNYTQNSASAWAWTRTASDVSGVSVIGNVSANVVKIIPRNGSDVASFTINNATAGTVAGSTDASGMWGVSRAASGTAKGWRNGVQFGTDFTNNSSGLPAQEQWMGGAATTGFSTNQMAFAAWGAALDSTQAAAFYSATLAYMQGVGAAA